MMDKLFGEQSTSYPRFIVLHLTDRCNFSCPMCSLATARKAHIDAGFSEMPFAIIEKIMRETRRYGAIINLFGGEPLLYTHLDETLAAIQSHKLVSYITTNGLLVEKKVESFMRNGLNILQISLDGWDEESQFKRGNVKGSFSTITKGIRSVLDHKGNKSFPIVRVATVITKNNYHSLDRIQIMLHEYGVREWVLNNYQFVTNKILKSHASFNSTTGVGEIIVGDRIDNDSYFSPEETKQLKKSLDQICAQAKPLQMRISYNWNIDLDAYYSPAMPTRESKCLLPFNRVDILADGSMTLCMGGYKIGNLSEETIKHAWGEKRRKKFQEIYTTYGIIPMCFRCCGIADTMKF